MSEKLIWKEIHAWEKKQQSLGANDFEMLYDHWINLAFKKMNPTVTRQYFQFVDSWLFHTHAFLQGSTVQKESRQQIVSTGRIFNPTIEEIRDMAFLSIDQLTYLSQQHVAKGRLYSFAQGGITGAGGLLLIGIDFPLMMVMNLRVVQLIGLTFGKEMNHPYEMMLCLKVFHAATLPKRLQKQAWDKLFEELGESESTYIYDGAEELTDQSWLDQPLKQIFKSLFIHMFRKKLLQGIPVVSVAIGAAGNYHLTKQVADFSLRFYQKRYLVEDRNSFPK